MYIYTMKLYMKLNLHEANNVQSLLHNKSLYTSIFSTQVAITYVHAEYVDKKYQLGFYLGSCHDLCTFKNVFSRDTYTLYHVSPIQKGIENDKAILQHMCLTYNGYIAFQYTIAHVWKYCLHHAKLLSACGLQILFSSTCKLHKSVMSFRVLL